MESLKNKIVGWMLAVIGRPYGLVVLLCGAFLVLFVSKGCTGPHDTDKYSDDYLAWKARAEIAEQSNDSLKADNARRLKFVDSVDAVIRLKDKQLATIKTNVVVLRKKNDKTLAELKATLPDTCKAALKLAEDYRNEADEVKKGLAIAESEKVSLQHANDSLKTSNTSLMLQNTKLLKIVRDVPEYKTPKLLKIFPLPSRTTSFTMGTVVGVLGTVAVYVAVRR
jgi:hypothetical protein